MDKSLQEIILDIIKESGGIAENKQIVNKIFRRLWNESRYIDREQKLQKIAHNIELLRQEDYLNRREQLPDIFFELTPEGYKLIRSLEKIDDVIKRLKIKDVKQKIKKLDFPLNNWGTPITVNFKIEKKKDEFDYLIEKNINEKNLLKIKENVAEAFKEKGQERLIRIPEEQQEIYIFDTVSGTAAVTAAVSPLQDGFLEKGGVAYPNYKYYLEETQELKKGRRDQKIIKIINLNGDHNIINFGGQTGESIKIEEAAKVPWYKDPQIVISIVGIIVMIVIPLLIWYLSPH